MKRTKKQRDEHIGRRMTILLLFFFIAVGALISRLFVLQVLHHREYVDLASRQHNSVQQIFPERGLVYAQDKDKNLIPLALNQTLSSLIVSPKLIKDPEAAAGTIANILNIPRDKIVQQFSKKDDPYEIIAKEVEATDRDKIEKNKIQGVSFKEEKGRVYPHGALASQLVGFVSRISDQETGQYGIERFFEQDLTGEKGLLEGAKDASGFWIALGRKIVNPSKNGSSVVLTIDYNIQAKAEEVLAVAKEKWRAPSGAIIVIDPQTGKILASAGNPSFDPNEFSSQKDFSVFLNPLVQDTYEAGSVIKPITIAGGVEEHLVTPDTTYQDAGLIKINGYEIKNFDGKAYGKQSMTQVLEKSLNTGAAYVAKLLGPKRQYDYLRKFGFGEKSGIELPGEVPGNLTNLDSGREVDFITASFGQGIAITPLQLAFAVGSIANGGNLMKPIVIEKVIDDSGNIAERKPETRRRVLSPATAETLTKMLVSVVTIGYENRAGVKGYFVAGKTGTAQIPNRAGRGYSDKVIHTFVGYAPAFHPRFLVVLQLNEPTGNRFASNTLTSSFHDLAEYILNYYEIPPDEK
ncbi:MAG: penicillin-binding protein 2 [Candidatus Sungbacteria bacterium]|nr:penicillin-binding protein 2 [Candidatus Sungbacteria bacterium]